MNYTKSQLIKLCTIALALTLFFGSIFFGSTSRSTNAANPSFARQDSADMSIDSPRVESVEATPLEKETAEGNARLLVRFAADQKVGTTVRTVIDDRDVLLSDDGTGSDERAGDGTYSAIIFVDFNELADNQDRVDKINSEPQPAPTAEQPIDAARTTNNASASSAQENDGASTNAVATATQEESLASADSVKMPAFEEGRDQQGLASVPKVDFRNVMPGQIVPLRPIGTARAVDPARSLVITDIRVVEDKTRTFNPCTNAGTPMGAWTFGYLMQQMANQPRTGIAPSAFVRQWLDKWMNDQTTANGWTAAKRQQIKQLVIDPWEAASGGPGMPLNLSKAPLRLLAIVNRVDLRANSVYGGGSAGEGRFVFGVLDMRRSGGIDPYTGRPITACSPTQFTVILEYGIDRRGCGIRDWGKQWYNLQNYSLGSFAYNAALQAITDQFTKANAAPGKPNGSAINQVRTNEIAIANPAPDDTWQMREFRLPPPDGHLQEVNVKLTPDETRRNTDLTANYVNANTPLILLQKHDVPLFWLGQKFLGNHSNVPFGTFWNNGPTVPIVNRQARHLFSLNTCSACHSGETATVFTHIKPAPFGTPAGLSGFMTGINVNDPADGAPTRNFNEFKRRALDLDKLVHSPCFFDISRNFFPLVH
ncbi:MAG TPA: hypothetical protein VM934_12110 [Pyrinomonadaceae bacterium]|nr:hypothetical protein [Pyrinomonadaceae bacterium]